MRPFSLSTIILTLTLVSCVEQRQQLWLKPGADLDEFSKARYACLQQSQQPTSAAYLNRYGGFANSNVITNGGLYDACMNSQGWILTFVTDVKAFNDAVKPIAEEGRAICSRADLQALFQKKMPCKALEASHEQLSDRSKISTAEKIALTKWVDLIQNINDNIAAIDRKYYSKNGEAVASVLENSAVDIKKLVLEFSNGSITWGEYNRRRLELNKRFQESQKIALTY